MGYGYAGVDSHDPDVEPISYWEFGFNSHVVNPQYREEFEVMIIGTGKGTYSGGCYWSVAGEGGKDEFKGMIDSNQTVSFYFIISMDSTDLFSYTKLVPPATLRQDLENAYKLKLLGNRPFYVKLRRDVGRIERYLDRKDSSRAYRELEGLRKELTRALKETEDEKGRKRRPKRFITPEAFDTLNEDTTVLLNSLTPKKRHKRDDDRDDREDDRKGRRDQKEKKNPDRPD